MAWIGRTVLIALQFILAAFVAGIIYGFIAEGAFTLAYIFNASFSLGAVIIGIALIIMIVPANFSFDKLTDASTFTERYYIDKHSKKQKKAYGFLFLGLLIIMMSGVLQLILAVLVR